MRIDGYDRLQGSEMHGGKYMINAKKRSAGRKSGPRAFRMHRIFLNIDQIAGQPTIYRRQRTGIQITTKDNRFLFGNRHEPIFSQQRLQLLTSLEPVKTQVGIEKMYRPDRCFDNCPDNTPLLQLQF